MRSNPWRSSVTLIGTRLTSQVWIQKEPFPDPRSDVYNSIFVILTSHTQLYVETVHTVGITLFFWKGFPQTFSLALQSTTEFFVFQQSFYWTLFRKLGRIPEEGPSFRVETSCSIKRLLEDEELCCCSERPFPLCDIISKPWGSLCLFCSTGSSVATCTVWKWFKASR